ncbi:MAG: FKBP-type peptidyl-prolyl cis-trans isomerase [Candidatus Jordarchaeum sp.]|uniref:FKBP-type peptidyl-prolyl cis-trans isomerase n=1 Tax=Candidatus Jordarchaeum sp. TaxID=2823881 RepID=UPI00404905AD
MSETEIKKVSKKDFILVDLIGRIKESGKVFESTIREVAEKADIYDEREVYKPRLVVVGSGWVLQGIDEALEGLHINETKAIEISPEKGFGERDPKNIKTLPAREFLKQNVKPRPGMTIRVKGRLATVQKVGGGRIRVDMNHPLAGQVLEYDVTVKSILDKDEDKIRALIERRIPGFDASRFTINISEKTVEIIMPNESVLINNIQFVKIGLVNDIFSNFSYESVKFLEIFEKTIAEQS